MKTDFNHYHCIYWVFTQLCNDNCDHCYNDSSPFGKRMSEADCMAIIDNLPDSLDHLMLSGGEPLAEKKLLYKILDRVQEKYNGKTFITLQFNGDLLNEKVLDTLIEKGVKRFSIASIDRYHKKQGARKDELGLLFESKDIQFAQGPTSSNIKGFNKKEHYPNTYSFLDRVSSRIHRDWMPLNSSAVIKATCLESLLSRKLSRLGLGNSLSKKRFIRLSFYRVYFYTLCIKDLVFVAFHKGIAIQADIL